MGPPVRGEGGEGGGGIPASVFLKALPVLPLEFRPRRDKGETRYNSELNELYRQIILCNKQLAERGKRNRRPSADDFAGTMAERSLHGAVNRLMVGDEGSREEGRKSLAERLKGKEGLLRMNLLGKRTDLSARAVIVPAPELEPHQVKLPLEMLGELLRSRLERELPRRLAAGLPKGKRGRREAEIRGDLRENGLEKYGEQVKNLLFAGGKGLLEDVWVLLTRAPSLHKYSVLSFRPVPWEEKVIGLHPLVCQFFNADFDGDTMGVFLPLTREAQRDAREKLPAARAPLSAANGRCLYHLDQDIALGAWLFTREEEGRRALEQWLEAPGLPAEERILVGDAPLKKGKSIQLVEKFFKKTRGVQATADLVQRVMRASLEEATRWGLTFGIFDVPLLEDGEDEAFRKWLGREVPRHNPVALMVESGAKGGLKQIRQLGIRRGQLQDIVKRNVGPPVEGNYRRGVTPVEYYLGSHAARRTMCEKKLSVAPAGAFTRLMVEAAYPLVVRMEDCGCGEGVELASLQDLEKPPSWRSRLLGRVRVEDDRPLDDEEASRLAGEAEGREDFSVRVRSVLTCRAGETHGYGALCRRCCGWDLSRMDFHPVGATAGIVSAQSIGERGTQLSMQTFHTGGGGEQKTGDNEAGGEKKKEKREKKEPGSMELVEKLFNLKRVMEVEWDSKGKKSKKSDESGQSLEDVYESGGLEALLREAAWECYRIYENKVDERHFEMILKAMLLADPGKLKPLRRVPMEHPGFLGRAAFQRADKVLAEAARHEEDDDWRIYKARLMMGLPVHTDTPNDRTP